LKVYNIAGQLLKTLVDENMSEGYYQITWDATDNSNRKLSSGVYFYRITAGTFSKVCKMLLLK
jgi:flagellar hook assembly protein FlgD